MMLPISGREKQLRMRKTEKAGEKPELKELGKDKTYTVNTDDIGSKIVLTVTGQRRKWLYRKSESCIRYSNRCADCCWPGGKSSRRKKAAAADTAETAGCTRNRK